MKKHLLTAALALTFAAAAHAAPCDMSTSLLGVTPLQQSASRGNVANIRCLLDAGADVNEPRSDGTTALIRAAHEGHIEAVRLLLDRGANLHTANEYGFTALGQAVKWKHTDVVRLLLDRIANPDAPPKVIVLPVRLFDEGTTCAPRAFTEKE